MQQKEGEKMQRVWTKLLVVGLVMGLASAAYSVTYQAQTTADNIKYWVGVTSLGSSDDSDVYRVDVSITPVQPNTPWPGYGLNWVQVKVSSAPNTNQVQDDTVIPIALPSGWSEETGEDSYFAEFSGPRIELVANTPITLSYRLTIPVGRLIVPYWPKHWSIEANYTNPANKQLQHSLDLVIPEPATLLLFGMGLAVPLGLLRRKI